MAQPNQFELAISAEDQAAIDAAIETLLTLLAPHLKSLTSDERKELPKMGDKSVAFVDKAREYAGQNPQLVPPFLDMAMFDADLQGASLLSRYTRALTPLLSSLEDSRMLAGSEAYQAALMIYHTAKMGASAGIPNAKAVYEDLANRFPGGARKRVAQPAAI